MRRSIIPLALGCFALLPMIGSLAAEVLEPRAEGDRSPIDLILSLDESWLVTANQTSHTISLVNISDGKVLHEIPAGKHPVALALMPGGKSLLVTSRDSGEVRTFDVDGERLIERAVIRTGFHPHGVAVAGDGNTAYVALGAAAQVAMIDLAKQEIIARIDVGQWPRYLTLSPDGTRLAVGISGSRGVAVVDVAKRERLYVDQFIGLNIGHMAPSRDGKYAYYPWMTYRANPINGGNIRLGWVLASRLARTRLDEQSRREAISLDPPGKAVADPFGIALTSKEDRVVVSSSGTHELLIFRNTDLPYQDRGSTDHIDQALLKDSKRFWRLDVGGRPMGLRISSDDRTVYVANYLENSVQVCDLDERRLVRSIPLGGPAEPSLARQGEAIFYDARRSLDQWYSCHSCHDDGGTNSVVIDTLNDGSTNTFKTVTPLWRLDTTGPWTWHGWQKDLNAAMRKSLGDTMLGPQPKDEDVAALLAYFKELRPPVNPHRNADGSLSEAAQRGQSIFEGTKAGCSTCHSGEHFTDGEIHDVGLNGRSDAYRGFNTPSLVGVYHKVKLLHDGRAESLEQVLTGDHAPEKVAGEGKLSDEELADLIEYLKSL